MSRPLYPLPSGSTVLPSATAFALLPVGPFQLLQADVAENITQLYRAALEQAVELAQPSLPERDLLGTWN